MRFFFFLFSFLITDFWLLDSAKGKDFGTQGHTFEIQEPDLLKEVESKLHHLRDSGELKKHQNLLLERAEKGIRTPPSVEGITKTIESQTFTYDPSITVPYDLKDHRGQVFHKKGTKINPLQYRSLSSTFIFIDGRDEEQITWVKDAYIKPNLKNKIILTGGSPFDLMETLKEPIYFDQGGTLTKKLGIKHVPVIVVQEGLRLKITEIVLEETQK